MKIYKYRMDIHCLMWDDTEETFSYTLYADTNKEARKQLNYYIIVDRIYEGCQKVISKKIIEKELINGVCKDTPAMS